MHIYMTDPTYRFDVEQTAIILFPERTPRMEIGMPPRASIQEDYGVASISVLPKSVAATCLLQLDGKLCRETARTVFEPDQTEEEKKTEIRHTLRRSVYKAFVSLTGTRPAWGALAGVRPGKLARKLIESGRTEDEARRHLESRYGIRRDKATLALAAAREAIQLKSAMTPEDVSVYLGIPFCPSRCAYCSFISKNASAAGAEEINRYLEVLIAELTATAEQLNTAGCHVQSLYIGGGTPTTLTAEQIARLLAQAIGSLPMAQNAEVTLEAGRPDTISREKLTAAAEGGVNRISINPQTFSNRVLTLVGRKHSVEDIYRVYDMARELNRFEINMDLIAGLPGDSLAGFANSVTSACSLQPDNITVHTLAMKKGSALTEAMREGSLRQHTPAVLEEMLRTGEQILHENGYEPYYLYRQKYSGGSFENVGYARNGAICRYNIYMMDELMPVVSCGAGAVTKLGFDEDGQILRIANPKYPEDYIRRAEEIIGNRAKIGAFYRGEWTPDGQTNQETEADET